jgi:uncharacterized protein (DUF1697 family)
MALVVLLRGVNVGGRRTFRPAVLAGQLKRFGAVNIGAAGTFVVRRPVSRTRLRAEISRRLPFDADIVICDGQDILDVIARNPFPRRPAPPEVIRFVSFLSRRPRTEPSFPVSFPPSGRWLLRVLGREGRFVFGQYRRHMKVIGYLGALDRLFDAPVTTRNWNTVTAIGRALGAGTA